MFGRRITYVGIYTVAVETRILGGVRTLYSRSEEQSIHLFERHAKELLNSLWSFWVELPRTERSTLAWQDLMNYHNLHYLDKTDIPLEEISDATLQCRHVINRPPV